VPEGRDELFGEKKEKGGEEKTHLAHNVLEMADMLVPVVLMRVTVLDRIRLVLLSFVLLRNSMDLNARLDLRETNRSTLQMRSVSRYEKRRGCRGKGRRTLNFGCFETKSHELSVNSFADLALTAFPSSFA
jgi:hypothetical protein